MSISDFGLRISDRKRTRSLPLPVLTRNVFRASRSSENHPVSRNGCHPSFVRRGACLRQSTGSSEIPNRDVANFPAVMIRFSIRTYNIILWTSF